MTTAQHPEYSYLNLLQEILDTGIKNVDRWTDAVSYSHFGRQMRFDLSKGFPLLTTKKVYWKGVLHELYWFLSGQSNVKYLIDNNVHIWDDYPYKAYMKATKDGKAPDLTKEDFVSKIKEGSEFADKWGNLKYIYGEQWRHWPAENGRTVDQVQWVMDELKIDVDARNCIVNSWNPEYLYSMALPEQACRFPICHNMYQVSIKDNKLSLQLYQRSADMFLWIPFNIASYALLTMIFARVLGVEPGEFIHTLGDAHIYENHIEQAREQLSREVRPLPTLMIDPSVRSIDDFRPEHAILSGYDPHPILKWELTIAGGFREDDHRKNN